MRRHPLVLVLTLAAVTAACASTAPPPKQAWAPERDARPAASAAAASSGALPPAVVPPTSLTSAEVAALDPQGFIKRYPRNEYCEEGARSLQGVSRDKAWEVLKACIGRGKFTLLNRLVAGAWNDDLQRRPEASKLIAKVIAMRGGDVNGDLSQMRSARVPLFPIGPAIGHPELYRGRLVVFRAEVRDVKLASGKSTARLAEFVLGNSATYVGDGVRSTWSGSSSRRYENTDGYGSSVNRSGRSHYEVERRLTSNTPVETGLEAVARLAQVDPFFEPGRQFVVLARFDGVREVDRDLDGNEGDPDRPVKIAVVSVVTYFEPAAAIVE